MADLSIDPYQGQNANLYAQLRSDEVAQGGNAILYAQKGNHYGSAAAWNAAAADANQIASLGPAFDVPQTYTLTGENWLPAATGAQRAADYLFKASDEQNLASQVSLGVVQPFLTPSPGVIQPFFPSTPGPVPGVRIPEPVFPPQVIRAPGPPPTNLFGVNLGLPQGGPLPSDSSGGSSTTDTAKPWVTLAVVGLGAALLFALVR
jgi:hypothetical protein